MPVPMSPPLGSPCLPARAWSTRHTHNPLLTMKQPGLHIHPPPPPSAYNHGHRSGEGEQDLLVPFPGVVPSQDTHRHGGVSLLQGPLRVWGLSAVRHALQPDSRDHLAQSSCAGTRALTVATCDQGRPTQPNLSTAPSQAEKVRGRWYIVHLLSPLWVPLRQIMLCHTWCHTLRAPGPWSQAHFSWSPHCVFTISWSAICALSVSSSELYPMRTPSVSFTM